MPHYLVTVQMNYRQMFLVEADDDSAARDNYADGEPSDYWHAAPEIVAVEQVLLEPARVQLDLFGNAQTQ